MQRTINIRSVQHYLYCPRRFALLETNKDWLENAFVVKANLMHENVHSGDHRFSDNRKVSRSSIAIYNDLPEYDLYGVTDCIEFVKSKDGVDVQGLDGKYNVKIIEYKPKPPKDGAFHKSDAIQVFAQKICADFVWSCDSEAYIYYSESRKRVALPFKSEYSEYDDLLKSLLYKMRLLMDSGEIPPREKNQKCSGCSIQDICFHKNSRYSVKDIILSHGGE